MKTIYKFVAAATLTSALAFAAVTPSEARGGRNAAAAIGLGVGVLAGAAIANSNNGYYGNGYYGPGYGQGYYSQPGYAYEPEPVYMEPAPRYYRRGGYGSGNGCWIATDTTRGYGYYGAC